MKQFFDKAAMQNHPLRVLENFLDQEQANETAKLYNNMRFVGYVLDIGYDTMTIITSDPFKINVGGIPRNSLLIMVPQSFENLPLHFTLLRVLESAPTPLSQDDQKTYFELHKRSMPELDVFTQSNLQWAALKTGVLGMFYAHPEKMNSLEFSGDLNNFVSAHKYRIYAPNNELLDLIVNSIVPQTNRFPIGKLRLTECRLPLPDKPLPDVTVSLSTEDLIGARTAMFGKTRLGKSNVVKLIAQSIIATTQQTNNVGQLIFDVNGEYSNDNPQDGNLSLRSAFESRCQVYALTAKSTTPSKPLKLNFYEQPESALPVLAGLLRDEGRNAIYVQSFASVDLPSIEEVKQLTDIGDKNRAIRKLQMYWAILRRAGFTVNEQDLKELAPTGTNNGASRFSPHFNNNLRTAAGLASTQHPETLDDLASELAVLSRFRRDNPTHREVVGTFDPNDAALLDFLEPPSGRAGPGMLQSFRIYHDPKAGDYATDILELLDKGITVILDLGNANEQIFKYFSRELSRRVFNHQVTKFSTNKLGKHFVQLYFEEAHNLFPRTEDVTTIYSRFAKEGAKYHIGMVYSTQSPTTINRDLLAQTENFFIAHLSSEEDVTALARVNIAYASLKGDIMLTKTPGYIRMLTRSHRFVVSIQANKFSPVQPSTSE